VNKAMIMGFHKIGGNFLASSKKILASGVTYKGEQNLHRGCVANTGLRKYTLTHNNTVPSTMQLFLFFPFQFPFHNMFRPQPAIIRYLNLSKLLYHIECRSFTSHLTAIFHHFKCNHSLANIS
jgi:hypothetical protein